MPRDPNDTSGFDYDGIGTVRLEEAVASDNAQGGRAGSVIHSAEGLMCLVIEQPRQVVRGRAGQR